jgi:hypothetical protein
MFALGDEGEVAQPSSGQSLGSPASRLLLLNAYLGARLLTHEHVGLGIFTTTVALILAANLTVRGSETARRSPVEMAPARQPVMGVARRPENLGTSRQRQPVVS